MALRRYHAAHQTAAGTNLTIAMVVATAAIKPRIFELIVGSDATPADVATEFNLIRGTVSGTGTALTVVQVDPGDGAVVASAEGGTFTGSTKTANSILMMLALNQRATFRWVCLPEDGFVVPAVADNWVGLESIGSGGTPNINASIYWAE